MKKVEAIQRQILLNQEIASDGTLASVPTEFSGFNLLNGELLFNQPPSNGTTATVNVYMSSGTSAEPINEIKPLSFSLIPGNGIKLVDGKITSKLTWS